ncbi:MAG TPA: cytochrome c biogenesis protein ResB, partial [Arthrobacter sp.]|nr:cytochrome c biogenesis protein ResB [Arthrobacter sp.]
GLILSLYVNRRRVWVRTGTHEDGRTMVEYGLLARGEDHRLAAEAAALRKLLSGEWQLDPGQDTARPGASQQTPSSLRENSPGAAATTGPATTPAGPTGPEKDQ